MTDLPAARADHATARVLNDPIRIYVNLGRRDRRLRVHAFFDDCDGGRVPQVTDLVIAVDDRARIEVPATVAGVDEGAHTLVLEPLWHSAVTILNTITAPRYSARSSA